MGLAAGGSGNRGLNPCFAGRFAGRSALITGGASGLGKATAARLVAEGAAVAIWDRDSARCAEARIETGATHSAAVDVSDANAVAAAMAVAVSEVGGQMDILICGAAIPGATALVQDFPVDDWERVIAVNLSGVFYCCRAAVPYMVAKGYGRIVNVASVAGKEGNPSVSAYSASKAGVLGFTKSLGKELALTGVLANALTPTAFMSPMLAIAPQELLEYMTAKIPMARLGTIAESVAMICFMASEECSFTTAATFDTSGGRTTY